MTFDDFVHIYIKLTSSSFFIDADICDTYNYMSFYTRVYLQLYE